MKIHQDAIYGSTSSGQTGKSTALAGMKNILIFSLALIASTVVARSQTNTSASSAATPAPPPGAPAKKSASELQKLAEPIALHPDPIIAVMLPAAAYPLEIVQAARFVKNTNNVSKVDEQPWDENVRALAKFPELISKMDADQ